MASLDMKECTFQPGKYNADELLAATRPVLLGETVDQRFDRLSRDDWARVTTARQAIHDAYYSKFSYKPEINAHSRVSPLRMRVPCSTLPLLPWPVMSMFATLRISLQSVISVAIASCPSFVPCGHLICWCALLGFGPSVAQPR